MEAPSLPAVIITKRAGRMFREAPATRMLRRVTSGASLCCQEPFQVQKRCKPGWLGCRCKEIFVRLIDRCVLLLSCLVPAAGLYAQEKPALPALPSNFQFTGTWDCEGAFRNAQVHKSVFSGMVVLGGKWLELAEEDVQPATGYLAKYLIGYDATQKHLVEFDANNFGAAVYSSEEGWKDGVLTMTSPVSTDAKAPFVANRFVYTVSGPDTFNVDWQISKTATLNWIQADHLSCKRRVNHEKP